MDGGDFNSRPADLFRAVALQDAALFDAYNRCDLDKFSSFFVITSSVPRVLKM